MEDEGKLLAITTATGHQQFRESEFQRSARKILFNL
ncbi:hypothetical protein SAMD00079811_09100 [Scytonema sp. HK-05]|nr:hypothetical protein SAMD00079811_09100 [Scytonema sp. HK-05]